MVRSLSHISTTQEKEDSIAEKQHLNIDYENPDSIPLELTSAEFEVLLIMLDKTQVLTTKAVQRTLDIAYILVFEGKGKYRSALKHISEITKKAISEKVRLKEVAELNKKLHLEIPSYSKIDNSLKHLQEMGIVTGKTSEIRERKGKIKELNTWSLNPLFYNSWWSRRSAIISEADNKKDIGYMLSKYTPKLFDFYLILRGEARKESTYVEYLKIVRNVI